MWYFFSCHGALTILSFQLSLAGSIFMTVAIAVERYNAVHHPVDFSQVYKSSFVFCSAVAVANECST